LRITAVTIALRGIINQGAVVMLIVFLINMTTALPALQGNDLLQTKFQAQ